MQALEIKPGQKIEVMRFDLPRGMKRERIKYADNYVVSYGKTLVSRGDFMASYNAGFITFVK